MMTMPPGTKGRYLANEEPFRIRRKGFWPLDQSRKVHVRHAPLPTLFVAAVDPCMIMAVCHLPATSDGAPTARS
jgi:hypothetical protein